MSTSYRCRAGQLPAEHDCKGTERQRCVSASVAVPYKGWLLSCVGGNEVPAGIYANQLRRDDDLKRDIARVQSAWLRTRFWLR